MRNDEHFLKTVLVLLAASTLAFSQYKIHNSVFGSGAGQMANDKYLSTATAGQAAIGQAANPQHTLQSGFWAQTKMFTFISGLSGAIPGEFRLEQNYPNPFNPSTTIVFAAPNKSKVTLKIFDVLGREVARLAEREYPAGVHQIVWDAGSLPTGIYFYRLQTEGFAALKKALLVK